MPDLADSLDEALDHEDEELEEEELEEEETEDESEDEEEETEDDDDDEEPAATVEVNVEETKPTNPFGPPSGPKEDFADALHFFSNDAKDDEDEDDDDDDDEGGSRRRRGRPKKLVNQEYDDDLQAFLSNFDMESGMLRLELWRDTPKTLLDGRMCSGYLEEIVDPDVNMAWVRTKYGGGKFRARLKGPSRDGRRKNSYLKSTTFQIAGDPRMPVSLVEKERREDKVRESQERLFKTMLEKRDAAEERARETERELREQAEVQQNNMFTAMVQLMNNRPDPSESLAPLVATMNSSNEKRERELAEQHRRDEERRREEREREETRRREENEQRRRDEEKAAREHAAMLERMRLDAQAQQAAQQAQAQAQAQAQQQQMQMMMQSQQQMTQMMMQMYQANGSKSEKTMQLQMEMQRQQSENMMRWMMDASKKDNMGETLAMLTAMRDFVNPPEVDDRTTVEKIFDKAAEAAPAVVGGLAALGGQRQAAQAQQPVVGPRPVAQQTTVAVVEDIDNVVQQEPKQLPQAAAPEQQTQPQQEQPQQPAEEEPQTMENKLKEFPENPYEGITDVQQGIAVLVHMIDLGIQRELEVDELYEKAIEPMPNMQKMILKGLPVDMIKSQIAENTPAEWEIQSAAGVAMIEALHAKLKDA